MYQRREKLQQISMISLILAILLTLLGLFKSFLFCLYLSCYMVSISICADGLFLQFSHFKQASLRLLVVGITLFIATTYLFFRFLKGS